MANDHDDELASGDWAAHATSMVASAVNTLRDRSVRPLQRVVRMFVLGSVAVLIAILAIASLTIGIIRLFDHDVFQGRAFATDFLIGGMFLLAGVLCVRQGVARKRHG